MNDWLPTADTPPLEAALAYAVRKLRVFPVHGIKDGSCTCRRADCNRPGKHPTTRNGVKDATCDPGVIRAWNWNDRNIGIATGEGVFVVDVDGQDGEDDLAALQAEHGPLPDTLESTTGRGRHLVFRAPQGEQVRNAGALLPCVDIRGDGGYIVAPPSLHASGKRYAWATKCKAATAPAWLMNLLASRRGRGTATDAPAPTEPQPTTAADEAPERVPPVDVPLERRLERGRKYLASPGVVEGTYPGMPPSGAGGVCLGLARALVWGLCIPPDRAVELMLESQWNKACHDGKGNPYPWQRAELTHKCTEAYERSFDKAYGYLLLDGERPTIARTPIEITEHEKAVTDELEKALVSHPDLFVRVGALVHVVRDKGSNNTVRRTDAPSIAALPLSRLREMSTEVAEFYTTTIDQKGVEKRHKKHPPDWCIKELNARGTWPNFRRLEAVVDHPILKPDGTILTKPGYDPDIGVLYEEQAGVCIQVSDNPTQEDAKHAVALLLDVVCDFPFDKPAHRATWIAAVLTLLARHSYSGVSPLFLIDANTRGSGKGLLADVAAMIATGRVMGRTPPTNDNEEIRKKITSLALAGESLVLIDNVVGKFGTPSLEAALTGALWKDRILGTNEQKQIPLLMTWFVTGNNVILVGDALRRCAHIRLLSQEERPETRQDFKHKDLLRWVLDNRPRLLSAALTILRAYCAAGRSHMGLPVWGSYERWSAIVRNAVVWVGLEDPGNAAEELQSNADHEAAALSELINAWQDVVEPLGGSATIAQVLKACNWDILDSRRRDQYMRLHAALGELMPTRAGQLPDNKSIGCLLRKYKDRIVGGKILAQVGETGGVARWAVRDVANRRPIQRSLLPELDGVQSND